MHAFAAAALAALLAQPLAPESATAGRATDHGARRYRVGEVAHVAGRTARISHGADQGPDQAEVLYVGDTISSGDTVASGEAALELFLGLNVRLRLAPSSRARFLDIAEIELGEHTAVRRTVEIVQGAVRARVRPNVVQPDVLVLRVRGVYLHAGRPSLAVRDVYGRVERGGTELLVEADPEAKTALITVLNGRVLAVRPEEPGRREAQQTVLASGEQRALGKEIGAPLGTARMLAGDTAARMQQINRLRREHPFRKEAWGEAPAPPPERDRQLDGP